MTWGDSIRFARALIALNVRQTVFRWRGGRGRCPCQSPSDSGRAWETVCEEAAGWDRPVSFRRVCPKFRLGPKGWRCSVDTRDVRPHWGRAAGYVGAALLACYLCGVTAGYVGLRRIGYVGFGWSDVAWPGRWARISAAQSEHFLTQARAALGELDERAMRLSLASAATRGRSHFELRLALAQINSYLSSGTVATDAFEQLRRDFPARWPEAAIAYHDMLVAHHQVARLGDLALGELAQGGQDGDAGDGAWLRAAFVALRSADPAPALLQRNDPAMAMIAAERRQALTEAAAALAGDRAAATVLAGRIAKSQDLALVLAAADVVVDTLPELDALDVIAAVGSRLGVFERERLILRVCVRAGAGRRALAAFDTMLRAAARPLQRERLLASLVEFPDPERMRRLWPAAANTTSPFSARETGALWVAAMANGDAEIGGLAAQRLKAAHGVEIARDFPRDNSPRSASVWARILPLGREIGWTLAIVHAGRSGEERAPATRR